MNFKSGAGVKDELATVAALVGEPARVVMLWTLLGGEARSAGEMAFEANISPQSASSHLAKLVRAGMLSSEARGKHRYYKIACAEAASVVEAMLALTPSAAIPAANGKKFARGQSEEFRLARTCYDHLAGRVAVQIVAAMQREIFISPSKNDFKLTDAGEKWLTDFGINSETLRGKRRCFARQCLDWSERQPHVAGALGAALLERLLEIKWLAKTNSPRVLRVTFEGRRGLHHLFKINV
jgi:DNA-binding transcriptional ArsR family regulator